MPHFQEQSAFKSLASICAERTNKLVFFIGSGLSKSAGLPDWPELRSHLLNELSAKAESIEDKDRQELRSFQQLAQCADSPWRSFSFLKQGLGQTTFRNSIRNALSCVENVPLPQAYRTIWQLNTAGILSLNLDRLATRSFSEIHPGRELVEFTAARCAAYTHIIKGKMTFVANLHGTLGDSESWVLTAEDLNKEANLPGYRNFLNACFCTHTIVFCGISADDHAAGGFLKELSAKGVDSGQHFWITNRSDLNTDKWSEDAGLSMIRYEDFDGSHKGLNEILTTLARAKPTEASFAPIVATSGLKISGTKTHFDDPSKVELLEPEELRAYLNGKATEILSNDSIDKYKLYDAFITKYDAAIHRAWHVRPESDRDMLFGYKLLEEIGHGAFGRIYRAVDIAGNTVAVKLLHETVRDRTERLQGFRRGVAAMRILAEREIPGIVAYKESAEIPALAVMDYLPGDNIANIFSSRKIDSWPTVLQLAKKIVSIIRQSHQLPERVLHRDIRPQNIMITNNWDPPEDWDVRVLDFDLAWHRDAAELSIVQPGDSNGYLAPEMIRRVPGVSTRSALVDAYGLGMTFYFLRKGIDPYPMASALTDWDRKLSDASKDFPFENWRSLPKRYFRIVYNATKQQQHERADVTEIESEIELLLLAATTPDKLLHAGLWAEEIAASASSLPYSASDDQNIFKMTAGGLEITFNGNISTEKVTIDMSWKQIGNERYDVVKKWLPRACDQVNSQMEKAGWDGQIKSQAYQMDGRFSVDVYSLRYDKNKYIRALTSSLDTCTFSH